MGNWISEFWGHQRVRTGLSLKDLFRRFGSVGLNRDKNLL